MEQEDDNPFLLQGYDGPENFCDRVDELRALTEAMANRRNVSVISLRRIGKTALIRHLFASQRKFTPVFVDLYRTENQQDMVMRLAEETFKQLGKPTRALLKEAAQAMRTLEFRLDFDALTGLPELGLSMRAGQKEAATLDELFRFLESRKKRVVMALDEFQQVAEYPEKNTEALLREHVQKLQNVNFIFSGSDRRMMQAIFADGKRPFYQATEPLYLGPIPEEAYTDFILERFTAGKRNIPKALVIDGIRWCRGHTYYVQYLFNRLYALGKRTYDILDLVTTRNSILRERAPEYMTVQRLLSPNQAAVLIAIAKDGAVEQPAAIDFIIKHRLSAASTVRQSLSVLLDKELLHQHENQYRLTDVFLGHWLAEGA